MNDVASNRCLRQLLFLLPVACVSASALLLPGCADSPEQAQSSVDEWQLTAEPLVSIGTVAGDERYALGLVASALYTAGGGIAVVDAMSRRLMFYDEDGRFVTSAGREGSGPGEFRGPQAAIPYRGDSIAIYDLFQYRISIFDAAGAHGRDVPLRASKTQRMPGYRPAGACCAINHALSDGSFILQYPEVIPEPATASHGANMLLRILPDGEPADTLGTFPGTQYRLDATTAYGVSGYEPGQRFHITTVGMSVFGGNGESPMLVRLTAGVGTDTVPLGVPQQPFTDELVDAYNAAYQAYFERRPEVFHDPPEVYRRSEFMPNVPVHSRIYSDARGHLWLQQWQVPYTDEPVVYHVHARDGRQLARITLPAGSRLVGLGRDRLLLVETDSFDVQYVRSYGIIRPGEPDAGSLVHTVRSGGWGGR